MPWKNLSTRFTPVFRDSIEIINSHFKCSRQLNIEVLIPDTRPLFNPNLMLASFISPCPSKHNRVRPDWIGIAATQEIDFKPRSQLLSVWHHHPLFCLKHAITKITRQEEAGTTSWSMMVALGTQVSRDRPSTPKSNDHMEYSDQEACNNSQLLNKEHPLK